MYAYGWLIPAGILLGAFGTLIGAGGGFLLVPLLLLLYPHESPETITSISLAVVFFNALSGSFAYARMGRIDYRAAVLFALAAIPGAVAGALSTSVIPRRTFDAILGAVMLAAAAYLWQRPRRAARGDAGTGNAPLPARPDAVPAGAPSVAPSAGVRPGTSPVRAAAHAGIPPAAARSGNAAPAAPPQLRLGMLLSVAVGYVSSLLGIGGGIVHVPLLVRVLRFPVHVATATSHLILAIMALAGTAVHVASGTFTHGYRRTGALAVGVVLGAQVGAYASNRIQGRWIIRSLAVALAFVGVRILLLAFAGHA